MASVASISFCFKADNSGWVLILVSEFVLKRVLKVKQALKYLAELGP